MGLRMIDAWRSKGVPGALIPGLVIPVVPVHAGALLRVWWGDEFLLRAS
jgi:hypothetical protein